MTPLTRVADLFTFSCGGNWNKQRGHVILMWLVARKEKKAERTHKAYMYRM